MYRNKCKLYVKTSECLSIVLSLTHMCSSPLHPLPSLSLVLLYQCEEEAAVLSVRPKPADRFGRQVGVL